jgi:hypothetical protein
MADSQAVFPKFNDVQVEFLEGMFPPRCLGLHESVEDHLRYAGKVELVAVLRSSMGGPTPGLTLSEEEQAEADEEEALRIAVNSLKSPSPKTT